MPIILIWNARATREAPLVGRLLADLNLASTLLERTLEKRLEEGDRIERLTRAFPVFRFRDDAISAFVTRAQFGAALTGAEPGWRVRVARVGEAWDLPRAVSAQLRQARLLPRLLGVVRGILGAARKSIERFMTPTAAMFAPGGVRAVDLVGLGALAFRSVGAGRAGIMARARTAHAAVFPPADPTAGGPPEPELPLEMRIEEAGRMLAGALLILPALGGLALTLGRDVLAWLRHAVLEELAAIEGAVLDARARLFADLTRGINAAAKAGVSLLVAVKDHLLAHLDHWVRFATDYMAGLFGGVTAFARQFGSFWAEVHLLITDLMAFGEAVMAIDISDFMHKTLLAAESLSEFVRGWVYDNGIGAPPAYEAPDAFALTLGDLLLGEGNGAPGPSSGPP